jgi:hypothetical protein
MVDYRKTCKRVLGEDIFEELSKFEIYKKDSNTALDPREIEIALQVVPRAIMSFLIKELSVMEIDHVKEIELPFVPGSRMNVNKKGRDNYSGEIIDANKVAYDFKFRSLPGVGLLLLTTFELYDLKDLPEYKENKAGLDTETIQTIIDERLKLYDLVTSVVNNRTSIREAKDELINQKLNSILTYMEAQKTLDDREDKKESKLKRFLDSRRQGKDMEIFLDKGEGVSCKDCGSNIFDASGWHGGCVCLGDDRNKKVWLKKTENGIAVKFSKGWDAENIQLLMDSIKKVK